jgi:hypothetical protein
LLTVKKFKKLQKIAILGIDLNSRNGIGYAIWTWNRSNGIIKEKEIGFIKSKIKPHFFQEKVLRKIMLKFFLKYIIIKKKEVII